MFLASIEFWKKTLERMARTAAQAAILVLVGAAGTADSAPQVNAWLADWTTVGGFAAGGAALALLFSIAGGALPFGDPNDPGLVK